MKLVIEHSETKREINGAFNLCGSRGDLRALARQIDLRLADETWSYGWMAIYPDQQVTESNTRPTPWDL